MVKIAMDSSTRLGGEDHWVPVFLKADKLLEIWNRNDLASDVSQAESEPKSAWFIAPESELGEYMNLARGSVSEEYGFSFVNGRHRTRWMLDSGMKEIPVFVDHRSYAETLFLGLLSRRAFLGESIPQLDKSELVTMTDFSESRGDQKSTVTVTKSSKALDMESFILLPNNSEGRQVRVRQFFKEIEKEAARCSGLHYELYEANRVSMVLAASENLHEDLRAEFLDLACVDLDKVDQVYTARDEALDRIYEDVI